MMQAAMRMHSASVMSFDVILLIMEGRRLTTVRSQKSQQTYFLLKHIRKREQSLIEAAWKRVKKNIAENITGIQEDREEHDSTASETSSTSSGETGSASSDKD